MRLQVITQAKARIRALLTTPVTIIRYALASGGPREEVGRAEVLVDAKLGSLTVNLGGAMATFDGLLVLDGDPLTFIGGDNTLVDQIRVNDDVLVMYQGERWRYRVDHLPLPASLQGTVLQQSAYLAAGQREDDE